MPRGTRYPVSPPFRITRPYVVMDRRRQMPGPTLIGRSLGSNSRRVRAAVSATWAETGPRGIYRVGLRLGLLTRHDTSERGSTESGWSGETRGGETSGNPCDLGHQSKTRRVAVEVSDMFSDKTSVDGRQIRCPVLTGRLRT